MKAAVIGSPVSHSLSPAIFEYIALDQGLTLDYSAIEVKPDGLSEFMSTFTRTQEMVGVNVTLPLKGLVYKSLTTLSEAATVTEAVNVVHFNSATAEGHNTDVIGIEKTFKRSGYVIAGKVCLLWGAGGSAKAVAYVLGKLHAHTVYVFNRGERGSELAQKFSTIFPSTKFISINHLEEIRESTLDLMINTTPLGMQGQASGLEYFALSEKLTFHPDALAFDLIYIPERTDFIRVAKSLGLKTISGLDMLIDQALATWEIWIGALDKEEKLHQRLRLYLKGILHLRLDSSPLYLTGFMGVGKSTVATKLAQLTQRQMIDSDQFIESTSGLSVPQIFKSKGEAHFRSLEKTAILKISEKSNCVVSLGGGSLFEPKTLDLIEESSGILVYLEADLSTLDKRILDQGTVRPMLDGLGPEERMDKMQSLLAARKAAYESAEIIVSTDSLSPMQVCFEIITQVGALS